MKKKENLIEIIEVTIDDYEKHSSDLTKDADFIYNMSNVLKYFLDYLKEKVNE